MKKVKITTIILAIILVSLVAFAGVYVKTQNRMENKVKGYQLGRELSGERLVEIKPSETVSNGTDENGDEIRVEQNQELFTLENYETVKKTIEKRLNNLGVEDYTISLNKENGTIRVELPENDKTDSYAYYLIADSKVEIRDKDTDVELLNDSMIKKAQYSYTSNSEGAYQVYLELKLTKEGQAKIEELSNDYAFLASEIDEIESAAEEATEDEENADTTSEDTEAKETETEENNETTKKVATLKIAGTEYDIEKIEKNKIRVKIGSQTSNNTSINNNMAIAAELTMLIGSGKYPVGYEVETNRYIYSEISKNEISYFALVVVALVILIFIIFIIKYKIKGLLSSISCVGLVAILSLVLRYTNVAISIEGIGAILLIIAINLKINQMILSRTKTINVVDEAVASTYKEVFSKLIPVIIITIVFCFSGWANLSSFGMVMFWGLILIAVYNAVVTKTLLKLVESK